MSPSPKAMKAALVGYGRMGRCIEAELLSRDHEVVARIGSAWSSMALQKLQAGVAFEFTTPTVAAGVLESLARAGVPTVSGTTGCGDRARVEALFDELCVPYLHAPNFSLGVQLMFRLSAQLGSAARRLPGYDAGVVERHHSLKKDAPSGTAREIAKRFDAASGRRAPIVSLRQGGQPGEHALILEGPEESLEIVHRARSPRLFAAGAVTAAEWLHASGRRGHVPFEDFVKDFFEEEAS